MKNFALVSKIIVGLLPLCASMCCPEEDDWNYVNYQVNLENVSTVINPTPVYSVGDTLFIETSIDFQQNLDGDLIDLSQMAVSETEGNFIFNVALYRFSNFGAPSLLDISEENLVPINGLTTVNNGYLQLLTTRESSMFEHSFGIILREAGSYSLGGIQQNSDTFYPINYYFRSDDTIVDIYSNVTPNNSTGNFKFEIVD